MCFKLGIINLLQEFAMVLCEKAFINAIKHLLFCCYWCNGKSMTDVTYGQFFWALSLPFILEKKEVLTFMLFLQGCWMRGKKMIYVRGFCEAQSAILHLLQQQGKRVCDV